MPGKDVHRRGAVSGSRQVARGAGRAVGTAREIGGAGNPGLMRLLDVHASASAGDTLVVVGMLTAIFFTTPVDEARSRVALCLLVTMVPFAILAPLIGPLLDRFRHGRRFALSASLALRAVLAWIMSMNVDGGLWLYVAAFGVVLLSRVYGVARSAALARLVPPSGLRLSQASARAAVFATLAGGAAAAFGLMFAKIGPQWPLRMASIVFIVGAVIALSLPALADTEPPEVLPRPFGLPWRGRTLGADGSRGESILSGRLVGVTLLGSGGLRLLYGFLLLFLAFATRSGSFGGGLLGVVAGSTAQLVLIGSAFAFGTLVATVVGTALRVTRPVPLQATGVVLVTLAGLYATVRFSFFSILVLCVFTAVASGLAKVAVDATVQERVPEPYRPNAFARTETLLMLVWLAGASIGLVPGVDVRIGMAAATLAVLVAMVASVLVAWRLRGDRLGGPPATGPGGLVRGELLQRGGHARALPPVPVAARRDTTTPAITAPTPPPPGPAAVLEGSVIEAPEPPAPPVGPAASAAPPGYHVFRPSPPAAPVSPPPAGATGGASGASGASESAGTDGPDASPGGPDTSSDGAAAR
jgi:MFS family permease